MAMGFLYCNVLQCSINLKYPYNYKLYCIVIFVNLYYMIYGTVLFDCVHQVALNFFSYLWKKINTSFTSIKKCFHWIVINFKINL